VSQVQMQLNEYDLRALNRALAVQITKIEKEVARSTFVPAEGHGDVAKAKLEHYYGLRRRLYAKLEESRKEPDE
jgi:hypothetical protein